ncbi:hypothetical protein Zmor_022333 [Zophobas morio]|uniref:Serpin domain-containing protein n=2 Tax=Zophobas morio TaxID=2755281 RepID=A0AA38HVG3_9CUCU|nr:hypothetical protein Zmor_022333 [Zophobas morio]
MFQPAKFYNYFESTELKARFLELGFQGRGASFVIVLPNEKDGLAALEEKPEKVFASHEFKHERVKVALPKFKIDSKVDFKKILKELGVSKMFTNEADLSGIAAKKDDLAVGEVVQKTFIDVNEEGVLPVLGFGFMRGHPKDFIVDRPFIFYIKVRGVVLFAGRVVEPKE